MGFNSGFKGLIDELIVNNMYHLYFTIRDTYMMVAVRSKWVCDRSFAGIAGSNPTAGMGF